MAGFDWYLKEFENHIAGKSIVKEPRNLYDPIEYILQLGGKRLRPVFTLMACDFFGKPHQDAMDAALAIELFHNFSLIHDDIMDKAPLRRGKPTIHEKWDINTGILSGDALLILAYQLFENYDPNTFKELAKLFSTTAIEVCEGQQMDMDFENRGQVSVDEYLEMIAKKTAVLLAASLKMGAIVANASAQCQEDIYHFGKYLGMAFQLQDDYLDAFGDPETFGKQTGGDIIENKKTFLYLTALKNANSEEELALQHLFSIHPEDPEDKVTTVKKIFETSGAAQKSREKVELYSQKAIKKLEKLKISEEQKNQLREFVYDLTRRTT